MAERAASINPKSFKETPLADLCFEDALKAGARRSESLKPGDFRETSVRFCVNGLRSWLTSYVKNYGEGSFFYLLRDASWHWASFCSTNPVLVGVRREYSELSKELVEGSSYTDLVERLQQPHWFKEFGHGSRPCNVLLPLEVLGVVGETGEAVGIPFSRLYQVGLAWSLSTNKVGLYEDWVADVFTPLFNEVMSVAQGRTLVLKEVRASWDCRLMEKLASLHK